MKKNIFKLFFTPVVTKIDDFQLILTIQLILAVFNDFVLFPHNSGIFFSNFFKLKYRAFYSQKENIYNEKILLTKYFFMNFEKYDKNLNNLKI